MRDPGVLPLGSLRTPLLPPASLLLRAGSPSRVSSPPSCIYLFLPQRFWSRGARCPVSTVTPGVGGGGTGVPSQGLTPPRHAPARALHLAQCLRYSSVLRVVLSPMETAPDAPQESGGAQALLSELEARVQDVVRASSWWERHGVDCAILALSLLALPPGEGHGDMGTRGQRDKGAGLGVVVEGEVMERVGVRGRHCVPGIPGRRVTHQT